MISKAEPPETAPTAGGRAAASPTGEPPKVTCFELRCLLCGRLIGSGQADRWGSPGPVLFRAEGDGNTVRIADWRRLRCRACGGNCYADEVRTRRVYPRVRWDDDDRPRRG